MIKMIGKCNTCKAVYRLSLEAKDFRKSFNFPCKRCSPIYIRYGRFDLESRTREPLNILPLHTHIHFKKMKGYFNDSKKCDVRCTHARGHTCECACGGENHGSHWEIKL